MHTNLNFATSWFEQFIYEVCKQIFGEENVLSRDKTFYGFEVDVIVLDHDGRPKYTFEPSGWKWHKNRTDKDLEKRMACKASGAKHLLIYDGMGKDLYDPEENDIWTYAKTFSSSSGAKAFQKRLCAFLQRFGEFMDTDLSAIDLDEVIKEASRRSQKISTDDFAEALYKVRSDLTVIGDFGGMTVPIKVRCNVCGHDWDATPSNLFTYQCKCEECDRRKREQQFLARVPEKYEVLDPYNTANTKIRVRCRDCGKIFTIRPDHLLDNGYGCPVCWERRRSVTKRKKVRNIDTGIIYASLKEAIEKTGITSIGDCCRKKIVHAGGFRWEYLLG